MPMDAAELESIIVSLQNVLITRYISAAGFVLLLYDHILTFEDEVEYIWSAPSTIGRNLFLLLRYMVPLFLTVETITRSGLSVIEMSDNSQSSNENILLNAYIFPQVQSVDFVGGSSSLGSPLSVINVQSQTYAGWLSIAISNFLVLLRIWTTLPRGHHLITWSLAFFVATQLTNLGVTTWPFVGLCTFTTKPNVVGLWVVGIVFEVVVFVTVWWNALDRPRAVGPDSDPAVTRILFRDGIVYFVILFGLRIANAVLAIVAPLSLIFVIVFFIWGATTLTTSRLIINSRRAAGRAAQMREHKMLVSDERVARPSGGTHRTSNSRGYLHSGFQRDFSGSFTCDFESPSP
ncbi:hypothetical protein C8R44DRAFT_976143 [Mycena epipterygia]|nr:hypothetical protein C8R44DRAFT_976143 [Mycena epipterygia]